jgi:hypothetical protein
MLDVNAVLQVSTYGFWSCAQSVCAQVLVELELPHLYHSVARNSPKRPLLTEKWGTFQVNWFAQPFICWQAPNTMLPCVC